MQNDRAVLSGLSTTLLPRSLTASLPAPPAFAFCLHTALVAVMAAPTFIFGMDPLSLTLTALSALNATLASLAFRELFDPQDQYLYLTDIIADMRNKVDVMEQGQCSSRVKLLQYLDVLSSLEAAVGMLGETILCPPSDTIQRRRAWSKLSQIIYLTNEACRMHSELSAQIKSKGKEGHMNSLLPRDECSASADSSEKDSFEEYLLLTE